MTAATTPSQGPIAAPIARLRDLVSLLPQFQDWIGVQDKDAALPAIHIVSHDKDDRGPLALIDLLPRFERERQKVQPGRRFSQTDGDLLLLFRAPADTGEDPDIELLAFAERVGLVMYDLEERSGSQTLLVTSWTLEAMWTPDSEELQHAPKVFEAVIAITYMAAT